jgi:hypothetical protein
MEYEYYVRVPITTSTLKPCLQLFHLND